MTSLTRITRLASLALALACGLSAEDGIGYAFKMGGGPLNGSAKSLFGEAGFSFGADFEISQPMGKEAALVYSLGYRNFPGDNVLLSFIPTAVTATGVNPTYYETRNRLTEGGGFFIGAAYRKDVWVDGFYLQGGLKVGRVKVSDTDTGTRITTNGTAISNTNVTTPTSAILAITAIASKVETSSTSLGVSFGAGYRITDRYSVEVNLTTVNLKGPAAGSKSGVTSDFSFSVRF